MDLEELIKDRVFYYFSCLSKIPHGSRNTKQISDHCVDWAKQHGFEYHQDEYNNLIIIKEASIGRKAAIIKLSAVKAESFIHKSQVHQQSVS